MNKSLNLFAVKASILVLFLLTVSSCQKPKTDYELLKEKFMSKSLSWIGQYYSDTTGFQLLIDSVVMDTITWPLDKQQALLDAKLSRDLSEIINGKSESKLDFADSLNLADIKKLKEDSARYPIVAYSAMAKLKLKNNFGVLREKYMTLAFDTLNWERVEAD